MAMLTLNNETSIVARENIVSNKIKHETRFYINEIIFISTEPVKHIFSFKECIST